MNMMRCFEMDFEQKTIWALIPENLSSVFMNNKKGADQSVKMCRLVCAFVIFVFGKYI